MEGNSEFRRRATADSSGVQGVHEEGKGSLAGTCSSAPVSHWKCEMDPAKELIYVALPLLLGRPHCSVSPKPTFFRLALQHLNDSQQQGSIGWDVLSHVGNLKRARQSSFGGPSSQETAAADLYL